MKAEDLTEMQVRRIEYIYLNLWKEKGTVGGARLWFEVICDFLALEKYEIKKKMDPRGPKVGD